MKPYAALFAAAALCAGAQETVPAPDAVPPAAPPPAPASAAAPAPDVVIRVRSLDSLRETLTAATTLAGQPQAGLIATIGLSAALGEAGLSGIRSADPAYMWVWDVSNLAQIQFKNGPSTPMLLGALPVAQPSEDVLDDVFERMESGENDTPVVWTDGEDAVFVTVRDGWTLVASTPELFDRAPALLTAPAALPEATVSFASDTLRSWLPPLLDLIRAEQGGDLVSQLAGDAPEWLRALVAFTVHMQELQLEQARDIESARVGLSCTLADGFVIAAAAKPAAGTKAAGRLAAATAAPLAADALAKVPAAACFWTAIANPADMPDGVEPARLFELVRQDLLPLVKDDARRARFDAMIGLDRDNASNVLAATSWMQADTEGRFLLKGSADVRSAEQARAWIREAAAIWSAEAAGCTNLGDVVSLGADGLSATVRVRPLVAALAAAAPDVAATIGSATGECAQDVEALRADLATAMSESVLAAASESAVAFLGEELRVESVFDGNRIDSVISAVGATAPDGPAITPDFGAEARYFPGQKRLSAFGVDPSAFVQSFGPTLRKTVASVRTLEAAEATEVGADIGAEPLGQVLVALPAESAPILLLKGVADGELTDLYVVSPGFIRYCAAFGDVLQELAHDVDYDFWDEDDEDVDFDDDEDDDDEDDDVDFDDDEF